MKLEEQTILISGGAGAIGSFLCEYLYDKAEKVLLIDIDFEKLRDLKNRFTNIDVFECDLTSGVQVSNISLQITNEYKITTLINNAGFIHSEPLLNILDREKGHHDFENWNKVIQSNLYSTFYLTSCIAKYMVKQRTKGLVINVSSIAAQGNLGQTAYSAAKAGIEAMTKTWSKEMGMFKIRCVCIAPGFFNTSSTQASLSVAVIDKWKKSIPLGKLGELDELAHTVQYLIENDYFNGKIIPLDGGLTI